MSVASLPSEALSSLLTLPLCAVDAVQAGLAASGCGQDLTCVCRSDKYAEVILTDISKSCNRTEQDGMKEYSNRRPNIVIEVKADNLDHTATIEVAARLCAAYIPGLHDNKGSELTVTVGLMILIATLAVICRLLCRKILRIKLGADDYMILLALVLTYGVNIVSLISIKDGSGRHMITLTMGKIIAFIKADQATQVLFCCAITAIKLSILLFYRRLFPYRTFLIVATLVGVVNILWWAGAMLTAFLHCRPFAFYWDKSIAGHCSDDKAVGFSITATEILTDIIVLLLPIPWLWGLKRGVLRRLAVVGLFVLGSFVCIAGIVRIPLLAQLKLSDATWTAVNVGVWINVECNIGILSACVPLLKPMFTTKYATSPASYFAALIQRLSSSNLGSKGSASRSNGGYIEQKESPMTDTGGVFEWSTAPNGSMSTLKPSPILGAPKPRRGRFHATWYSAAITDCDDIETFAFKRENEEVGDDLEANRKLSMQKPLPRLPSKDTESEGSEDLSSGYEIHMAYIEPVTRRATQLDMTRWNNAYNTSPLRPLSVGPQRKNDDLWNLMPSIAEWGRKSILV